MADIFYCFKLGPIPTGEASFDMFVGMRENWIAPMVSGVAASAAMKQLAAHGAEHELRCEPRLARAGKRHGFVPGDPPPSAHAVRCGLAVCLALGPSMPPDCMLPAGQLASAAGKFFRAAPWQYWHSHLPMTFEATGAVAQTFEGCLMGNAGQEYGVALYEEKGAIEKLLKLHDEEGNPSAAKQVSCISVTFDVAPDFAAPVLTDVIGAPVLPIPTRVDRGRMGAANASEILTLAAALVATSGLTPTTLTAIGGASDGDRGVTVKVTAPEPP